MCTCLQESVPVMIDASKVPLTNVLRKREESEFDFLREVHFGSKSAANIGLTTQRLLNNSMMLFLKGVPDKTMRFSVSTFFKAFQIRLCSFRAV